MAGRRAVAEPIGANMNQKTEIYKLAYEAVAKEAYLLWEQAGRPNGRDDEFWMRARANCPGFVDTVVRPKAEKISMF